MIFGCLESDFVLRVVVSVAESKLAGDSGERSYVVAALERLLLDYDHNLETAWRMLAFATAADVSIEALETSVFFRASREVDRLKDDFKAAVDSRVPLA